jgi:gas vesicle protein
MKYKKLLSDSASKLTDTISKDSDSSNAIVALLAGLAVGAVLGVLFAPSSGEETRSLIADRASGLGEDLKDKYQSVKEKVASGREDLIDLKDRVTDNVKTRAGNLSQEFKDFKQSSGSGNGANAGANGVSNDVTDPGTAPLGT